MSINAYPMTKSRARAVRKVMAEDRPDNRFDLWPTTGSGYYVKETHSESGRVQMHGHLKPRTSQTTRRR